MIAVSHPALRHARAVLMAVTLLLSACAAAPDGASARARARKLRAAGQEGVAGGGEHRGDRNGDRRWTSLAELPPELRDTPLGASSATAFRNRREQMMGAGSGFIIDPSGVIVTNNHVVGHADKIVVSLVRRARELPARVIGDDELTDVAVIKVQASEPLPSVPLGRQPPGRGRRLDAGRRQSVRSRRLGHRRHRLGARAATSAPGRSTTSCSSMRRSIPAIPAGRSSTWTAR